VKRARRSSALPAPPHGGPLPGVLPFPVSGVAVLLSNQAAVGCGRKIRPGFQGVPSRGSR